MKELFIGFLNVSISGSFVIGVILLLRLLFRRGSKTLNCVFWLAAFVRLLMPFQIRTPWSLLPLMPFVSNNATQLLGSVDTVLSGSLPAFIPQTAVINNGNDVVVDYVAILGGVWGIGVMAMLLYMVISYIAFGEISIRQRIKNVLSAKKPAVWVSVIAVVAVLLVSFFLMTDPIKPVVLPQYYEELESLIGKDKDTVCEALNITQEQLGYDPVSYVAQTSLTAEFMGEPFVLTLYFGRDNGLLGGFRYHTTYDEVTDDTAAAAASVARQLWNNYGKGFQWELKDDPKLLKDITGEEVLAIHRKVFERTGDYKVEDTWNLTKGAPDNVKTYLNQMEISDLWRNMHGERAKLYEVSPRYYLSFSSSVEKETETTYIVLEYKTGWIPGRYSVMVTGTSIFNKKVRIKLLKIPTLQIEYNTI